MLSEGLTTGDIFDLALEYIDGNEAAATTLAMRETMLAMGAEESEHLDEMCESKPFFEMFVRGVAAVPIDARSQVTVLKATAGLLNELPLTNGRRYVLRQLGKVVSKTYYASVFEDEGYIRAYEHVSNLQDTCRKELPRISRSEKMVKTAKLIWEFTLDSAGERLGLADAADKTIWLAGRADAAINSLQTP